MYTLLTGAKINMGDFLITDRSRQLLSAHLPHHEHFVLPHWLPFDEHLEKINSGKAIIILGGPGYQPKFYPGVYKLTGDIDKIKVPVIPMGLGWKGYPGDYKTLINYRFTSSSLKILNRISEQTKYLGCRDYMTLEVLERNGIKNGLMTGCPVWYNLDAIGKEPRLPEKVKTIVVTPAQRPVYQQQSIELLKSVAKLFPDAKKLCSFNRGIAQEHPLIPDADIKNNKIISTAAEALGYETVDTSFGLDKIKFYEQCDLHVGYRVHSHLHFLSARKPSLLLHEDGRGRGISQALNILGIDAFAVKGFKSWRRISPASDAVAQVERLLADELQSGFLRYAGLAKVIDAHYEVMKKFIKSLP